MADALVGATIQVLLEKLISLATERIGLIIGFKEELQSLRESADMIQAVLADAEDKQRHNQAVQLWLRKLEGVAFDADNVLDEINYEVLRRKVESLNQLKGKTSNYWHCFLFSCYQLIEWSLALRILRLLSISFGTNLLPKNSEWWRTCERPWPKEECFMKYTVATTAKLYSLMIFILSEAPAQIVQED